MRPDLEAYIQRPRFDDLMAKHGSIRQLCIGYWAGALTPVEERYVEQSVLPEQLANFKTARTLTSEAASIFPPSEYEKQHA